MLFTFPGRIELHFGPMFSEKTGQAVLATHTEAVKRRQHGGDLRRFTKPEKDTRSAGIYSRMGTIEIPCERFSHDPTEAINQLRAWLEDTSKPILLIDEGHFFPLPAKEALAAAQRIVDLLAGAARRGSVIIIAGLDTDYRRRSLPMIQALLLDPRVEKYHHTAFCEVCNAPATLSQGLLDGAPAPLDMPTDIVEGSDPRVAYQPRCIRCHEIPD